MELRRPPVTGPTQYSKEMRVTVAPVRQALGCQGQQQIHSPEGKPRGQLRGNPHHVWCAWMEGGPNVCHLALHCSTSNQKTEVRHPLTAGHKQCICTGNLQGNVVEKVHQHLHL